MKRIIGHEIKKMDNLLMRKIIKLSKENRNIFITPIQGRIMKYLTLNESVYQKDLEKKFNLRRSTVSEVLNTMERNSLIVREIEDGSRSKKIELTDTGKNIACEIEKEIDEINNELIKGISEKELDVFYHVLDKMKENIEEDEFNNDKDA